MKTLVPASLLLLTACTGEITGTQLHDTTRVPAEDGAVDVVVEPDRLRLVFEDAPPTYRPGEIVYGTEGPGYLRRVTAVERRDHAVVLDTTAADLADAFAAVSLDERVAVRPDGAAGVEASALRTEIVVDGEVWTADVSHAAPVRHAPRALSTSFSWAFPDLSITLTDPEGVVALTLAAESLTVEKTIALDVAVELHWFQLEELRFVVEDDTETRLEGLSLAVTGALPVVDVVIPIFEDPAIAVVPAGPLVFTVGTSIDLHPQVILGANATVTASSGVGYHSWSRRGFVWDGQVHPIDQRTLDVDTDLGILDASLSPLTVDASLAIEAALNFKLYGLVGPELYATITPLLAHMTFGSTAVDGTLSAQLTGGLRIALPGFQIPNTDLTFGAWSTTYATFHQDY